MCITVVLYGCGVIPLCPADVNGLGSDAPILCKSDNGGVNLAVSGIKAAEVIDACNLGGVITCLGILIVFVGELYVINAVCVDTVLGAVVGKLGGSGPNNVGSGDNLLCDINGNNVGGNGLGNNTLRYSNDAVVFTAVGNVNNLERIGSAKRNVSSRINLIPLIGVGSVGGVSDNLYERSDAVVGLVNVSAYGNGELLVKHSGKNGVAVGHCGNEITVFVNPSNNGLAVYFGNGSEELYVLVLNSRGKEALTKNVAVFVNVGNLVDFLKVNVDVNGRGNRLLINEGCNERTVLCGNLCKHLFDINGMSALIAEYAVALIEAHKRLIAEGCGNLVYDFVNIGLCFIEVALVFLYLCDDFLVGKVCEVNVLFDVVAVKHALEVNRLEKLKKLVEGEVVVINLEAVNVGGASLEHLELKLVGDEVGLACLNNSLMEHLGNVYVEGVYTIYNAYVNVVGNNLGNLTNLIVAAADNAREGEIVATVLGNNGKVVGEIHLVVCHSRDFGGSGKIENNILDRAGFNCVIAVFAKGSVNLDSVNVNLGNVVNEVLVGNILAFSYLNVVLELIERDSLHTLKDLLCKVLDLLLGHVHKRIHVGAKGYGKISRSRVVGYDTPAGIKGIGRGRGGCTLVSAEVGGKHGGSRYAEEHGKNKKHRQNGTKCLFHFVPTFL